MMYLKLAYWLLGLNFSKIRDGIRNQDENNITHVKKHGMKLIFSPKLVIKGVSPTFGFILLTP
jgi:hypothetical protein